MNRVAIASSGLGEIRRGNESWARSVAEALHDAGQTVHLYGGGPLKETGCPYTSVWNIHREWRGWPRRMGWGRRYAYEQQSFAWALGRRLERDRAEIVHVGDPVVAYRLNLGARRKGLPVVYKDGLLLGANWCQQFDWVQVLAPYYLDQATKAGLKTDRWFAIPHFVDVTRFTPPVNLSATRHLVFGPAIPENAFIVLAVGDFAAESNKRIGWIVSEINSLGPDSGIHLLLAGQASPADIRRVTALSRPLGDRVHLRPNTGQDRMPELYQVADVFAHAALREPFGMVFTEALATGLPTVGHSFPVTSWIIGPGGATADMTRPGELAQVLDLWRREPGLRSDLGAAALRRVEAEFTAKRNIPLYRQLYSLVQDC